MIDHEEIDLFFVVVIQCGWCSLLLLVAIFQ